MVNQRSNRNPIGAGTKAGLLAGTGMALVAMLNSWAAGLGFWLPMKNIAAIFFGVEALIGGAGVVLAGIALHLVNSAVFGAIFGALTRSITSTAKALAAGLVYGAAIWAVATYVLLPLTNTIMLERVSVISGWWFTYHMIFGAILSVTPMLQEQVAEQQITYKERTRAAS